MLAAHLLRGEGPEAAYRLTVETSRACYADGPYEGELPHFEDVLSGRIAALSEARVRGSGYVVHTLEAALWCLLTTGSYREAVLRAVNLGEDTDTTACVTGGLAGLCHGLDAVPAAWRGALARHDDLQTLFARAWDARPASLEPTIAPVDESLAYVRGSQLQSHSSGVLKDHELMDPPWAKFPQIPLGSIGWRMGYGEEYWCLWRDWYMAQSRDTRRLVRARFPEPQGWEGFYARLSKDFAQR
jgi:hypothetical protein